VIRNKYEFREVRLMSMVKEALRTEESKQTKDGQLRES
jgi:hypothetical protein